MATIRRNRPLQISRPVNSAGRTLTTTVADDDILVLPLQPNSNYEVSVMCQWTNAGAGDFKYGLKGPQGSTASDPNLGQDMDISAGGPINDSSADNGMARATFFVRTGAKGGNLVLQWCQKTSDEGATVLRAGSYLSASKVN